MQQNRSRMVWIIAIAVAFFFFIDPFRIFSGDRIPTIRLDRETRQELADFAASAPSGTDLIVDLLQDHDLVLLGETGYVAQHAVFAAQLIPALDEAGIRYFGYGYANREDQDLLDQLTAGNTFNEDLARQVLFNHLTVFGFREHVEIMRAAWEVNSRKAQGEQPFRIIALSNRLDYEAIARQEDVEDPAVMRRVFATGVPDDVMAQIMAETFLTPQIKAVAFMQLEHAFTGLPRPDFEAELGALGIQGIRRAGNALRADFGDRVVSAVLHGPIQDSRSRVGVGYPTAGVIDSAVEGLPEGRVIGFRTATSPFADVPIISEEMTSGEDVTVAQFADAWVVVAPISRLTALTPIENFITEENLDAAVRQFPGPSPMEATAAEMNEFISGNAESMTKVFSEFR